MTRISFCIAAALCALGIGAAQAQDYLAVAPQGKTLKLDNAHVRVIEISLAPGQRDPVHTHPANLAYILSPGKVRVSYVGGPSEEMEARVGDTLWSDPEGPHTIENLGRKPVRYLLVELKDLPYQAAAGH